MVSFGPNEIASAPSRLGDCMSGVFADDEEKGRGGRACKSANGGRVIISLLSIIVGTTNYLIMDGIKCSIVPEERSFAEVSSYRCRRIIPERRKNRTRVESRCSFDTDDNSG